MKDPPRVPSPPEIDSLFSSVFGDRGIPCVDRLDIDSLPAGQVSRVLVSLIHDALGRAMRLPVLVVKGAKPGPVLGVTAALHGNELNGIPVVHSLVQSLNPKTMRGAVAAVPVLNLPGFLVNQRNFSDGMDLNHIMPGKARGNESSVYAYRLTKRVISSFDRLADLHTASRGRVNTLYVRADLTQEETAAMALLQRPSIVLHNPPSDHTLRGWASGHGAPAITIEIGNPQVFQPSHVKRTIAGLRALLVHLEAIPRRPATTGPRPVVCESSRWIYTTTGGLLRVHAELGAIVEKGELLASQVDVLGDPVAEYRAPFRGAIIGKSANPVSSTGARVVHLGKLAPPGRFPFVDTFLAADGSPDGD